VTNTKRNKIRDSFDDKVYYLIVNIILAIVAICVLYPLIFVVSASFSSREAIMSGRVFLWPIDFTLEGYQLVFQNRNVIIGYRNSLIYTFFGTSLSVFFTMVCAYPLSKKELPFRKPIMFLFIFTMFFGGGMIPNFMLMRSLGILNTRTVMIIPGMISVFNMIIARTFIINTIPEELQDAAMIDGCRHTKFFFKILLPLSKAVMAVLALQYGVGRWNAWFGALIYLTDRSLFPLQLFLRQILIANQISAQDFADPEMIEAMQGMAELLQYSLIVVASVPVILLYPLVQKYFTKGVMLGSVKG